MSFGLVPSGKRRTMHAQSYDSSQPENALNFNQVDPGAFEASPGSTTYDENPFQDSTQVSHLQDSIEEEKNQQEEESKSDKNESLQNFILNFLVDEMGYPPRRAQDYKSKFVQEKGSRGQQSEYTITLPDQIYGSNEPLSKEQLKKFVKEIEKKFNISYEHYNRSDIKIELTFTSHDDITKEDVQNQESEEELENDVLDSVYGGGHSSNASGEEKVEPKQAESIHEMIKKNKTNMFSQAASTLNK